MERGQRNYRKKTGLLVQIKIVEININSLNSLVKRE